MPGLSARLRGSVRAEEFVFAKPGESVSAAAEDVRRSWRSCGLVEEVYWPGNRRTGTLFGTFDAVRTAPAVPANEEVEHRTYTLW